jgi:hypothetical protein
MAAAADLGARKRQLMEFAIHTYLSGWWFQPEKYESQWEGLSHI